MRTRPKRRVLHQRALANGSRARLVSADEAKDFEPHVAAVAALRIESTGIIDYAAVAATLARLAEENGAELLLATKVVDICVTARNVTVQHDSGSVEADLLINCAGLHSDRIAILAGLRPEARIIPFRGEYYELVASRRNLVRGLIYPVPDPNLPFLGVHLTRMVDGSVHAGPNAVLALAREGYRWGDIDVRETLRTLAFPGFLRLASHNVVTGGQEIARSLSKRLFASSLARLVPEIHASDIVRAGAGVRAQAILPDGSLADDFIIQKAARQARAQRTLSGGHKCPGNRQIHRGGGRSLLGMNASRPGSFPQPRTDPHIGHSELYDERVSSPSLTRTRPVNPKCRD